MDLQAKAAIVFLVLLAIILYAKRDKLFKQNILSSVIYILMYRTKIGLKFMDNTAKKHPKFLKYAGNAGIFIGFLGMIFIGGLMIKGTYDLFSVPEAKDRKSVV